MSGADTIFALATAPGKSGVAVIRLSGPFAIYTLKQLTGKGNLSHRRAQYVAFKTPSGELLDRGLALAFHAPHSFTGEDVAELHLHGSLSITREMLSLLAGFPGLRPAERGEFSRRAYLNGKMDLIEAEGLNDLIEAETSLQKSQALRQMEGGLSEFYQELRAKTIQALALLEAYIDFPDEDIPESVLSDLSATLLMLATRIRTALDDRRRGERLRDGIQVAILGAPNAGKSTLLNQLAERDVAIVSPIAGTTRDTIELHLDIAGFPVTLIDTAGLRDATDSIEAEGVRRAHKRAAEADIKLLLFDGTQPPDEATLALFDPEAIALLTKADLNATASAPLPSQTIAISAETGHGINQLISALEQKIHGYFSENTATFITRARHRGLLVEALIHIEAAANRALPLELQCEELRRAALSIGKITGIIQVDDVLDVIFRQFCIGK